MGVAPDECQMPCRSGSPHGVLGAWPMVKVAVSTGMASVSAVTARNLELIEKTSLKTAWSESD